MQRVILHVDANSFYASVECLYRPSERGRPLSVCGDPEQRHGIVLASNIRNRTFCDVGRAAVHRRTISTPC